jgi:hypothetical protein
MQIPNPLEIPASLQISAGPRKSADGFFLQIDSE